MVILRDLNNSNWSNDFRAWREKNIKLLKTEDIDTYLLNWMMDKLDEYEDKIKQ